MYANRENENLDEPPFYTLAWTNDVVHCNYVHYEESADALLALADLIFATYEDEEFKIRPNMTDFSKPIRLKVC